MQSETPSQRVATLVKTKLRALGISQDVVADRLKVSQQAVSRRITGEVEFSLSELNEIAEILGTTSSALLDPAPAPAEVAS